MSSATTASGLGLADLKPKPKPKAELKPKPKLKPKAPGLGVADPTSARDVGMLLDEALQPQRMMGGDRRPCAVCERTRSAGTHVCDRTRSAGTHVMGGDRSPPAGDATHSGAAQTYIADIRDRWGTSDVNIVDIC